MTTKPPGPADVVLSTGGYFNIFEPHHPDNGRIRLQTVARALSNICRWGGHCQFFSVAEHSVLVSYMVPPEDAAEALMHDAGEAIVGDLRRPLKYTLPTFLAAEVNVETMLAAHFGLRFPYPASVKVADSSICWLEQRVLFDNTHDWGVTAPPDEMAARLAEAGKHGSIRCLAPDSAFSAFMIRAAELGIAHG